MSQLTDRLIPESEEAVATEMTEMLDRLLQVKDVRKKKGLLFTSQIAVSGVESKVTSHHELFMERFLLQCSKGL